MAGLERQGASVPDPPLRNGFDAGRVQRVTAHADREPASAAPMDLRNNRLEIVFLRRF